MTRGGVAAERESETKRDQEKSGCNPHPEMLCWLREDEMSVQELLQRVECVITHVGKSSYIFLVSPLCLSVHVSLSGGLIRIRGADVLNGILSWEILRRARLLEYTLVVVKDLHL